MSEPDTAADYYERDAREGYQRIVSKFSKDDDFGPQTVREFVKESAALGDMTPEQVQMDAYQTSNDDAKDRSARAIQSHQSPIGFSQNHH